MIGDMNTFSIADGQLAATYSDGTRWELPLSAMALVGEYTTEDGPGGDDHFICIVDQQGNRYDVSDEEGSAELLHILSRALKVPLSPKLALETRFDSRILYPVEVSGQPLFTPPTPSNSIVERMRAFFGNLSHPLHLSREAEGLVAGCKGEHG